MARLQRAFYARSGLDVAPDLLGKVLVRRLEGRLLSGRVVETEAYCGASDPGSHAYRGETPRNNVMFGEAGHVYVYMSYGAHFCMNVVTDRPGIAGAVLLRALQPLQGIDVMETRRGGRSLAELCNGPGKLCQALAISRADNGTDLQGKAIWMEDDGAVVPAIAVSTRVGLSRGVDFPWRFFVEGSPYVSPGRPSVAKQKS